MINRRDFLVGSTAAAVVASVPVAAALGAEEVEPSYHTMGTYKESTTHLLVRTPGAFVTRVPVIVDRIVHYPNSFDDRGAITYTLECDGKTLMRTNVHWSMREWVVAPNIIVTPDDIMYMNSDIQGLVGIRGYRL
jgi:hypothetical protein